MLHHTMAADRVSFRLNGAMTTLAANLPATTTLLHWLRGPGGLCGTKEGCAEGDCGACTVVLEEPGGGRTPINACLVAVGQLHGASLRTVEGLRAANGSVHPVQRALAEANATQCGFCTPGFVMAAWAYAREGGDMHEALAGNLCRCTGYRPIVDALASLGNDDETPPALPDPGPACFIADGCTFHRPTGLAELLALRQAHPQAWLLAGGTDLGLALAEGGAGPREVIGLLGVPELRQIATPPDGLRVGAAASYARLMRAVQDAPELNLRGVLPLLARLGSRQIRGLGTLGGNLATASPIGDALPPLIALGATVRLRSGAGARELPVEAFLRGYRSHALGPDEVIESVFLPCVPGGALFVCEKLSKRHDQDIATVSAAFLVQTVEGRVQRAVLAFGGMGPIAARAPRAEAALIGAEWSPATLEHAAAALADDFAPLSDWRGSAEYRRHAAAGLLRRLWWRSTGSAAAEVQALEPV